MNQDKINNIIALVFDKHELMTISGKVVDFDQISEISYEMFKDEDGMIATLSDEYDYNDLTHPLFIKVMIDDEVETHVVDTYDNYNRERLGFNTYVDGDVILKFCSDRFRFKKTLEKVLKILG